MIRQYQRNHCLDYRPAAYPDARVVASPRHCIRLAAEGIDAWHWHADR
jgi:hypothetical protein